MFEVLVLVIVTEWFTVLVLLRFAEIVCYYYCDSVFVGLVLCGLTAN